MDNPLRGWRKLSKAQLVHLIESKALEHDKFIEMIKWQKGCEETNMAAGVAGGTQCHMCKQIAKKLGLWNRV